MAHHQHHQQKTKRSVGRGCSLGLASRQVRSNRRSEGGIGLVGLGELTRRCVPARGCMPLPCQPIASTKARREGEELEWKMGMDGQLREEIWPSSIRGACSTLHLHAATMAFAFVRKRQD